MKTAICTISTQSHLFKSKALYQSVSPFWNGDFFCLVSDSMAKNWGNGAVVHDLDIFQSEVAIAIKQKYKGDKLRWALKSVYLKYLLEHGYERVIYVDNDIYFFSSPELLFEKLKTSNVLLTPHFYPSNPTKNQNWLEANFRVGLYNAGFIGVNKNTIPMLDWWSQCCLYTMKKAYWRGLYDDQKYLDLVPVLFDEVEILKHRGCNLAGWNCSDLQIESKEKKIFVNDEPVVFVHFTSLTFEKFASPNSKLTPLLNAYLDTLLKENSSFVVRSEKFTKQAALNYLHYICWRIFK